MKAPEAGQGGNKWTQLVKCKQNIHSSLIQENPDQKSHTDVANSCLNSCFHTIPHVKDCSLMTYPIFASSLEQNMSKEWHNVERMTQCRKNDTTRSFSPYIIGVSNFCMVETIISFRKTKLCKNVSVSSHSLNVLLWGKYNSNCSDLIIKDVLYGLLRSSSSVCETKSKNNMIR